MFSVCCFQRFDRTVIKMSNYHILVVDLNKAKARELEQSAIQNARVNPEIPVRCVLLNLTSSMDQTSPMVLSHMSKKSTLSRIIRKERCKENETEKIPRHPDDFFNLPRKYTVAGDGSEFLRVVN